MDRLGDDLTELILSYLTFEDKVRLECTAKQWQRLIFNKQTCLEIVIGDEFGKPNEEKNNLPKLVNKLKITDEKTEFVLNLKALESVLKKCPNLVHIIAHIDIRKDFLELIGKYCPELKGFHVKYVCNDCLKPSLWKFAPHLEYLTMNVKNLTKTTKDKLEELVKSFDNLKVLNIYKIIFGNYDWDSHSYWYPNTKDKKILPKLESINSFKVNTKTMDTFEVLAYKYCNTLKTLIIIIEHVDFAEDFAESDAKTLLSLISRFKNLTHLTLIGDIYFDMDFVLFRQEFKQMFRKLSKLKFLSISGDFVCRALLLSLSESESLQQLVIDKEFLKWSFDVRQMSVLPNLKALKVKCTAVIFTDRFAADVEEKMPRIQFLNFVCCREIQCTGEKREHLGHIYVPLSAIKTLMRVKHIGKHSYYNEFYYGKYVKKVNGHPKLQMLDNSIGLIDHWGRRNRGSLENRIGAAENHGLLIQ